MAQAVDLIQEEDIPILECNQDRYQIAQSFNGRCGQFTQAAAHLGSDDGGDGGFSQARAAGEVDMINRCAANLSRRDHDGKGCLGGALPDEIFE